MFEIAQLFSDRNSFESKEVIIDSIRNSKNFTDKNEDTQKADALIIFMTSRQHTWLVCTEERLYCILDDLKNKRPHINWSLPKSELVHDSKLIIKINSRNKTADTGLVDIGENHRGWLYSKKLFLSQPIETMIRKLISRQILLHEH